MHTRLSPCDVHTTTATATATTSTTQVVYSYGFNQDASCVAVGTSKGYAIYNCKVRPNTTLTVVACDPYPTAFFVPPKARVPLKSIEIPLNQPHTPTQPFRLWMHEPVGGVAIAEMLFCTSLLALIGAGAFAREYIHTYMPRGGE